ncbi:acetyl-CoA carboxylase biotin carboxyl carrier protein [Psychrobacter sp. PP-21]|uniref:acetyl-CoA carboxylase biotin carboxyl carrier protein n=1 Tax=Psychrobacter sp. PP-21 TaxID=2957503 RepID=UPI0029BDD4EF|nr:acetyl-CoA carboxylase biotin carboxyl carrier protein [Psychrobacter sp. PP-21]MDX2374472.1 acetyl-CoA carboxylase biotin carboxyl carrier protein [Psychrobacter sp. PP-21]
MNINFADLERLIELAESADIQSLEVSDGDARISIVCQSDHSEDSSNHINNSHSKTAHLKPQIDTDVEGDHKAGVTAVADTHSQVIAPMLGTFYLRSEPTAEAFFEEGDQVAVGQTLCIIEAMKMMHEVKAEVNGTIQEILIEEGEVVEYAQPLFIIVPDS